MVNGVPTYQASLYMAMSGVGSPASQLSWGLNEVGNYDAPHPCWAGSCRVDQTVPFSVSEVSGKLKRVDVGSQSYGVIVELHYKGDMWVSIEPYLAAITAKVASQTGCSGAGTLSFTPNSYTLVMPLHC